MPLSKARDKERKRLSRACVQPKPYDDNPHYPPSPSGLRKPICVQPNYDQFSLEEAIACYNRPCFEACYAYLTDGVV